jgi:crotonobetainyl-CoA:carnitine CoA-transferase CaiB-like acyl-CoA transferase
MGDARLAIKALDGVRVLDFTWSVAGPRMTTILASLGAEVIKVEWPAHPDMMRTAMYPTGVDKTLDSGCFFATINPGKLAFSVDVRTDEGHKIIEQLIAKADLVTESFSSGVMERWGFSYEQMVAIKPDIIYLSISGFGHSGRYRPYDTWGPTAQAFNGLAGLSGLPGQAPAGWGFSYMDITAGNNGAIATLMALYHHRRTGEGQYIDMAQTESGLALSGPTFLDSSVNGRGAGRVGVPPGNRSVWPGGVLAEGLRGERGAPYNCYPTDGAGRFDYCAITVLTDDQWESMKDAMERPEWADELRYSTVALRIANQDDLDAHVTEWTSGFDKYALMTLLQERGVPAGALQSPEDLSEHDPQLKHRGMFARAEHPILGDHQWEQFAFKLSDTPAEYTAHWPLLGGDNDYVLKEVLELSDEDVAELAAADVTWPKGMPRDVRIEKSLW